MPNLNEEPKRVLARRDYVLLPAICVLTVVLMFVVSEMGTRLVWPAAREGKDCHREDAALGMVNVPNCTMRIKVPETSWITYHYNECGFRSTEACGPKRRGDQCRLRRLVRRAQRRAADARMSRTGRIPEPRRL